MRELLKNFNELVLFKHSIFSFPFIFIAMEISAKGWFGFKLFLLGLLSALTARNFAMAFNRYLDKKYDKENERTKNRPSVDGRISKINLLYFIFFNGIGFILITFFINKLAFILSFPILLILASYSFFKRFSSLAHTVLGISLGLAPIAGVVAIEETIHLWTIYLSFGVMFWVAGFDLLYSLQDIEFDKSHGLHSIPVKFGIKNTFKISALFHVLTILFWYLFVSEANLNLFAYLGVFISFVLLVYEHILIHKDFNQIDKAFFTVNGYLGIIFFIFITINGVLNYG